MHAYLIVSKEEVEIQAKIKNIIQKENAQKFKFWTSNNREGEGNAKIY